MDKTNYTTISELSKFRNTNNVLMFRGIFYETSTSKPNVVYTLKDFDHKGYPSLYRLYMEEADPTEYLFATKHLESWEHWLALCEAPWFKKHVHRWRQELELKAKAQAIAVIVKASKGDGRDAVQAAKYLAEKGWDKSPTSRGRPSKDQVNEAARDIAHDSLRLEEDFQRITEKLN
jgi:hypothetical protein